MDTKELRDLIEIISRSNFATFELEHEGFRLRLVKDGAVPAPPEAPPATPAVEGRPDVVSRPPAPVTAAEPAKTESPPADDGFVAVPSPIVGTYYEAPSPGTPPFVSVGDQVKKGQVLCIVEAMKLMNEIESDIDGEVVEILATNGQPVEYGDVLFKLRPAS